MHLFYPSHDIALANGVKHFNPPKAAQRLEEDLAPLAEIFSSPIGGEGRGETPIPWAWDYDTRALLHKDYGVRLKDLPTDEELRHLRELSSRKTTIEILKRLKEQMPGRFDAIALGRWVDSDFDIDIDFDFDSFVLKSPWSSSGRGLARSDVWTKEALRKHAEATIKKQGGVIVEPWYKDKIQDLAELFYVGKDSVRFVGYSIFHNDENGTYRYGELMSNTLMAATLPRICGETRDVLITILEDLFRPFFNKSWEVGYIGVDMFLLKDGSLNPCVEMNVRCTMGVVARLFFDKTFGKDSDEIGEFYITPALDYARLKKMDSDFAALYRSRYHRLTPLTAETRFMAYAIMT